MTTSSSPAIPPYRITLFFGPDVQERDPDIVYCVFNVKKRSWKGGMQCVVELAQAQVSRCKRLLRVESWLRNVLRHLPQEECDEYFQRGQELCLQHLCRIKLRLAIEYGLKQDRPLVAHDILAQELENAVGQTGQALKAALLEELDVPPLENDAERSICRL